MTKLPKHPFDRARGRRLMGAWTGLALAVCVLTAPALAADDPLTIVNNLSEFIFSCIRAIGIIILGWGVVQVGLSVQGHDRASSACSAVCSLPSPRRS